MVNLGQERSKRRSDLFRMLLTMSCVVLDGLQTPAKINGFDPLRPRLCQHFLAKIGGSPTGSNTCRSGLMALHHGQGAQDRSYVDGLRRDLKRYEQDQSEFSWSVSLALGLNIDNSAASLWLPNRHHIVHPEEGSRLESCNPEQAGQRFLMT